MSLPDGDKKPAALRVGAPMGSKFKRPHGSKAAKRQNKEEVSLSSLESTK
jgi:hypothetical protein